MKSFEDRLDYFDILENKVKPWGVVGYECLVCGKQISANSDRQSLMDFSNSRRGLAGNARGAMTNHLKAHMRHGDI